MRNTVRLRLYANNKYIKRRTNRFLNEAIRSCAKIIPPHAIGSAYYTRRAWLVPRLLPLLPHISCRTATTRAVE